MFWKNSKNKQKFKCSKCGETHNELPALGFRSPYHYNILSKDDKEHIANISDDFCIIKHEDQTDRFIRTTFRIQINDACEDLDYGIWVSLSKASYDEYESEFKANTDGKTYFGMICNEIADYNESTLGLHVNVETKANGIRPEIIPHQTVHDLIKDWENGISFSEANKRIDKMMKSTGQ